MKLNFELVNVLLFLLLNLSTLLMFSTTPISLCLIFILEFTKLTYHTILLTGIIEIPGVVGHVMDTLPFALSFFLSYSFTHRIHGGPTKTVLSKDLLGYYIFGFMSCLVLLFAFIDYDVDWMLRRFSDASMMLSAFCLWARTTHFTLAITQLVYIIGNVVCTFYPIIFEKYQVVVLVVWISGVLVTEKFVQCNSAEPIDIRPFLPKYITRTTSTGGGNPTSTLFGSNDVLYPMYGSIDIHGSHHDSQIFTSYSQVYNDVGSWKGIKIDVDVVSSPAVCGIVQDGEVSAGASSSTSDTANGEVFHYDEREDLKK